MRRFDKSGEYKADGSEWPRWKCKLSAGAAAERMEVARQLDKLPTAIPPPRALMPNSRSA